jgi:hypothetical protein
VIPEDVAKGLHLLHAAFDLADARCENRPDLLTSIARRMLSRLHEHLDVSQREPDGLSLLDEADTCNGVAAKRRAPLADRSATLSSPSRS